MIQLMVVNTDVVRHLIRNIKFTVGILRTSTPRELSRGREIAVVCRLLGCPNDVVRKHSRRFKGFTSETPGDRVLTRNNFELILRQAISCFFCFCVPSMLKKLVCDHFKFFCQCQNRQFLKCLNFWFSRELGITESI